MDKRKSCEGCIDRRPGCHAGCLEYLERSKAIREAAEARRKERAAQTQIDDYERDGYHKRNMAAKPKESKPVYEPKEDCRAYMGDRCAGLKEMFCKTKGKCNFYKPKEKGEA